MVRCVSHGDLYPSKKCGNLSLVRSLYQSPNFEIRLKIPSMKNDHIRKSNDNFLTGNIIQTCVDYTSRKQNVDLSISKLLVSECFDSHHSSCYWECNRRSSSTESLQQWPYFVSVCPFCPHDAHMQLFSIREIFLARCSGFFPVTPVAKCFTGLYRQFPCAPLSPFLKLMLCKKFHLHLDYIIIHYSTRPHGSCKATFLHFLMINTYKDLAS